MAIHKSRKRIVKPKLIPKPVPLIPVPFTSKKPLTDKPFVNPPDSAFAGAKCSIGAERLRIELEDAPLQISSFCKKYEELVATIVDTIGENLAGYTGKEKEERFITEVWGIMTGNMNIKFGSISYLYESLTTNVFDCDISSFLVYDVAKKLGINAMIVIVIGHAIIKTDYFFFETTSGRYYPIEKLSAKYPKNQILTEEQIQSISYNEHGVVHNKQGNLGTAMIAFNKAITLNPNDASVYNNRGNIYGKQGNFETAKKDYSQAIALNPNYASAYYNRADAYHQQGNLKAAIEDYFRAIALNPNDADAYYNRGNVHNKQGNLEAAIRDNSRAITLNPNYARRSIIMTTFTVNEEISKQQ